jgi:ribose transport system ATP-binding protein
VKVPIVSARGFSKTFAGRTVLRNVDLDIMPGEIHALVGQNGSGKSTLIKILSGYHAPDHGATLRIRGDPVSLPLSPGDPRRLGLAFVHQDLGLFDTGTVVENLRLTNHETRFGWRIPWKSERRYVRAALERFGLDISPDTLVSSLRDVDRAMIAVLRAVEQLRGVKAGLLVLDEATAYLPQDSTFRVFEVVRHAADLGFGVLFVSHRLEDVHLLASRVSVLRDGSLVAVEDVTNLSESDLIRHILGFSLEELYPEPHHAEGEPILEVRRAGGRLLRDFSIHVHRGEIVGLTGLVGMGWEEIPYLLLGAESGGRGMIRIGDREHDLRHLKPRAALKSGLALLPANRLRDGAVGSATVRDNVTIASLGAYFQRFLLRSGFETTAVRDMLATFQVRPADPGRVLSTLSGGNQQKVILAKWFATTPKVFLMHEPTQGVDIGARKQIFTLIRNAADSGTAMLLASAEYEDLAHLCDRVIVFRDGRPVSQLSGQMLTHERLLDQCFRGRGSTRATA